MPYANLLYFLVVIFLFSSTTPTEPPGFSSLWILIATGAIYAIYFLLASRIFARVGFSAKRYFTAEKKMSLLAVACFAGLVWGIDIKYYLQPLSANGQLPILTDLAGLGFFYLFLFILWLHARQPYQHIFQVRYTPGAFFRLQFTGTLPIILPWAALSLLFDGLALIPLLHQLLASSWGNALLLCAFVLFLIFVFPPLVCRLWGCQPLPENEERKRLLAFCRRQQFQVGIYTWPLFEGKVLTAGIMGILPRLRYLLITPALLAALEPEEIDSVLAHEIGHVKHHHLLLYLALFLSFSLVAGELAGLLPHYVLMRDWFYRLLPHVPLSPNGFLEALTTLPILVLLILYFRFLFGFFLRNFERQADAYAFRAQGTGEPLIRSFATIAQLSGTRPEEKSWHHFGLGERIDFLRRCEKDRFIIIHHDRKLYLSMLIYFLCVSVLSLCLHFAPSGPLPAAQTYRFAEAKLTYNTIHEPRNSRWWIGLGNLSLRQHKEQQALKAYTQALVLAPNNAEVYNNLAWLHLTAQDPAIADRKEALSLALKAVQLARQGFILDTLAMCYWAEGEREKAIATEQEALQLDAGHEAYYRKQLHRFATIRWDEMFSPEPQTAEPETP